MDFALGWWFGSLITVFVLKVLPKVIRRIERLTLERVNGREVIGEWHGEEISADTRTETLKNYDLSDPFVLAGAREVDRMKLSQAPERLVPPRPRKKKTVIAAAPASLSPEIVIDAAAPCRFAPVLREMEREKAWDQLERDLAGMTGER